MEDLLIDITVSLVLSALLGKVCHHVGLLTPGGATAAFLMGTVIGTLGSTRWLFLLVIFAILGFVATNFKLSKKTQMGVQEGTHGERRAKNIIGVALPPLIIAVMDFVMEGYTDVMSTAFIATIAVAAADTAASELGVSDSKVWLITNFKRVAPGTDGGVSVRGTLASVIASLSFSIIGYLVIFGTMDIHVLIPAFCGIIGCFMDSIIGATLETRGIVSKYANNCITGLMGGLLAIPLYLI